MLYGMLYAYAQSLCRMLDVCKHTIPLRTCYGIFVEQYRAEKTLHFEPSSDEVHSVGRFNSDVPKREIHPCDFDQAESVRFPLWRTPLRFQ